MCGICGWFNYSKPLERQTDEPVLRAMCNSLAHRGPDDEGIHIGRHAALGMRRLSIIDIKTGNQPIYNEDKTVTVICNGEIYNFKQLRAELEKSGHRFYTNSDVEVIVHLYEERGTGLLQSLRGMFAFAIFDSKKNLLFLARDRIGKKPLVYTKNDGHLVFASEIKSLLEFPGIEKSVNREAIDLYLTYQYVPSPLSAFNNIFKLPPAHFLICNADGSTRIERYWNVDFTTKSNFSAREWEERVIDKLNEATRLRMISDVPLGAFLSGGIDSSAVVALMAAGSSTPVKTFSIGFKEEDYSELKYAAQVARHVGSDHHELIVEPGTVDILPKLAWHYNEPFGDSSALPSYYVARETRRYVTVALNGDGGDESFAGYLRYRAFVLSKAVAPVAKTLSAPLLPASSFLLKHTSNANVRRLLNRLNIFLSAMNEPPARRNLRWHSIFNDERKAALYSADMRNLLDGKNCSSHLENLFIGAPANNDIDRLLYTDIMSYLPECLLVKMDIASMANSLEARSPFLDHELIELAAHMPAGLKLHGLTGKYILKKALRNMLPAAILNRKKMGFAIPVHHWFRGDLKNYISDILLSPQFLQRNYFDKNAVERLIKEHNQGAAEHGYRLWSLLMLELWHRAYNL
ncbi:MAG: asparagine synthase (glutamine-hydrolyzing) [Elusimicrobia bacterium RIFOXYA2_FULL_50_26]|nr:MAG: asparagine synthase (glutamine-hydrolyzing) [Elusimicrobia bacterium RIFOXYA2_FULL_50_26]